VAMLYTALATGHESPSVAMIIFLSLYKCSLSS